MRIFDVTFLAFQEAEIEHSDGREGGVPAGDGLPVPAAGLIEVTLPALKDAKIEYCLRRRILVPGCGSLPEPGTGLIDPALSQVQPAKARHRPGRHVRVAAGNRLLVSVTSCYVLIGGNGIDRNLERDLGGNAGRIKRVQQTSRMLVILAAGRV